MSDGPSQASTQGGDRLAALAASFERFTGAALTAGHGDLEQRLWAAPRAIVAHGLEPDPIFFYANRLALELFETPLADFLRLPSRLSAEPLLQDARARLMAQVARDGFVEGYSGTRISAGGRRFRIEDAVIWNVVDDAGRLHGQAAAFDRWSFLD